MAITVKGDRELVAALARMSDQVRAQVGDAVADEAVAIRRDEQQSVPVDTGALRAGITSRRTGELTAEVGIFNPKLKYAIWIEWGRKSAAAQPFATPAAEQGRQRWPRRAADVVRGAARA